MSSRHNSPLTPPEESERLTLARKLKDAREYLGLSQDYVSQQTTIPRPAVSEIEAGRRRVESLELKRLATLYGRPLNYFLQLDSSSSAEPSADAQAITAVEAKLRTTTRNLPKEDIQEILQFAEYLRHRKQSEAARVAERKQP
ncbi:MAG: helix-turn-helix domain-containing protein [Bryobacteraceae bacterium]|jgi:transcriptional regulator with XRE-family HTH domain